MRIDVAGLLRTVILAVVTICLGGYGLIEGRNELCAPFAAAVPGVTCPPLTEPAAGAAFVAVVVAVLVVVLLALLRHRAIRRWRIRIHAGEIRSVPVTTTLYSFGQAFAIVAAIILFVVLSARQTGGAIITDGLRSWPMQLTTGLLTLTALSAAFWRRGHLVHKATQRWGMVHQQGAGSGILPPAGNRRSTHDGFDDQHHPDEGGYTPQPPEQRAYDPPDWSPQQDSPPAGIRDGLRGDGPQQGTRSLADEPGSPYGSGPQHGTKSLADEPGGLYSSDPFGTESK